MPSFDDQIENVIPAMIYMFAGSEDRQQSADVTNVGTFTLPDPAGKAGGACTSALLQVLYRDEDDEEIDLSWTETLDTMREKIEEIGLPQVPQLSCSRIIDVNDPMRIVPDDFDESVNVKRAMLVGINYVGEQGELTGCHNDTRNMKDFLIQICGFQRENMLILMDDGKHHEPTKELIMNGFRKLAEISEPGDVIFIQFSGHGGQMADTSGDEDDGMDEILIPGDYKEAGQIVDDEIYEEFVTQVRAGVTVTAMIDCCHSGTAMDLPYICSAGEHDMHRDAGFKIPASGMDLKPSKPKSSKKKKDKSSKKKKSKKKEPEPEPEEYEEEEGENYEDEGGEYADEGQYEEEDDGYTYEEGTVQTNEGNVETVDEAKTSPKKKKKGLFGFGRKKK